MDEHYPPAKSKGRAINYDALVQQAQAQVFAVFGPAKGDRQEHTYTLAAQLLAALRYYRKAVAPAYDDSLIEAGLGSPATFIPLFIDAYERLPDDADTAAALRTLRDIDSLSSAGVIVAMARLVLRRINPERYPESPERAKPEPPSRSSRWSTVGWIGAIVASALVIVGVTIAATHDRTTVNGPTTGTTASSVRSSTTSGAVNSVSWVSPEPQPTHELDQELQLTGLGRMTFWATQWQWAGSSTAAYMGLQSGGIRVDGTVGGTAIFSIWNAVGASGGCEAFTGGQAGQSCRVAFDVKQNSWYLLRLVQISADEQSSVWRASVIDESSTLETEIARIAIPAAFGTPRSVVNFAQFFGEAAPCGAIPASVAEWAAPAADPDTSSNAAIFSLQAMSHGECAGGTITPMTFDGNRTGIAISLGGE